MQSIDRNRYGTVHKCYFSGCIWGLWDRSQFRNLSCLYLKFSSLDIFKESKLIYNYLNRNHWFYDLCWYIRFHWVFLEERKLPMHCESTVGKWTCYSVKNFAEFFSWSLHRHEYSEYTHDTVEQVCLTAFDQYKIWIWGESFCGFVYFYKLQTDTIWSWSASAN